MQGLIDYLGVSRKQILSSLMITVITKLPQTKFRFNCTGKDFQATKGSGKKRLN